MDKAWAKNTMDRILTKLEKTMPEIGASFPHACVDDKYDNMHASCWTNGFWPGTLWLAYQYSKNEAFANTAKEIEEKLDEVIDGFYKLDHDVGFIWQLSAGPNYKFFKNEESKLRMLKVASVLASRFNLKGNFIQAWNHQLGWAIVDCTMNLPILCWASSETENPRYRYFAEAFAKTVANHFVREDGSVNHILSFDPDTGELIESIGGQGNAPDSAWSRGASWALYGLPLMYRHSGDKEFLTAAKKVAHFFIANLPEDFVAHWDFRVPRNEDTPRDTSATACAACGLLEIAKYVPEAEKEIYETAAKRMLVSLTDNYSNLDNNKQCILTHGTSHCPENQNVNVGLIYADYFYVEGISRLLGNEDIFWYAQDRTNI
ncbi:MAG: glycoside hydrolase family 88 protein [Eubacteriales bacterium]|nr:glycoside hydrolase family 88 protein [Eubacteriales bacterium]